MNIEEIYDLELKYQEVYKRTKDYTRNDFVIELIKKDDEKQELIEFLKEEQDRLARECSHIYEDSLGKTRLVSEDIYNEVSKILSKIEKSDK